MVKKFGRVTGVLISLAILAAPFLVWWQWNAIYDWARLRDYTPPAAVSSLASQDTMTAYAKHLFYVNHPELESDASQFRTDCSESEKTIVLGCYHSTEQGIFIYNVQDSRLAGVQQVTAAHEMLHAAYDRLSVKERDYVDGLLQDYYNNDLQDQRIKDTINAYKQSEPKDIVNEMHSVFGTEVSSLPAPLETYYKQYFTNRQAITNFAAAYENEFTSRENQINGDDAQLTALKQQIDSEEQGLNQQLAQINSDRARLDSLRGSNQIDAYNASIGPFNAEVDSYNRGVAQLKSDIANYNDLVNTRNSTASELRGLDSAIDTRLTTQASQ